MATDLTSGGSADSHIVRYRTDVDGLRAIAVLSVVFFHVSKSTLPGGYLGVDVFFVLSGYLITSIVWREARAGQYSIMRFYDRRVRRIMPALILVLVVTTVASTGLLLPSDLMGYARSLVATVAFVPNIYFWRDTNYFSTNAAEKPLLHMWSLGVEEQFYVLFPLILLIIARRRPRAALAIMAVLTAASFGANAAALYAGGDSPAFFLLPTRAWELGVGAILALLPTRAAPHTAVAGTCAWSGTFLLTAAIVHPLYPTPLIPIAAPAVAGVALLILAGERDRPAITRALGVRPMVFFGLISYSLYLWHWPILVLSRYYLARELKPSEMAAALIAVLSCAFLSWRYVERPFRSNGTPIRTVRYAAGGGAALLVSLAIALLWTNGLPGRLNAEAAVINQAVGTNYRCPVSDYLAIGGSRACLMNLPSRNPVDADVVLLGNSHAQMYAPLWASILEQRRETGLLVPLNACLPTVQANLSRGCIEAATRNLLEVSKLPRAGTVIIGLTWAHGADSLMDSTGRVLDNRGNAALISALDDLIAKLHAAGKQAVLIGPIAEPGWDVASTVSRQLAFGHSATRPLFLPSKDFTRQFATAIGHFEARRDIGFARPDRVECGAERCDFLIDGRSLFSDGSHIAAGELQRFRRIFEAALPTRTKQR